MRIKLYLMKNERKLMNEKLINHLNSQKFCKDLDLKHQSIYRNNLRNET
jgi:hypothetical protein